MKREGYVKLEVEISATLHQYYHALAQVLEMTESELAGHLIGLFVLSDAVHNRGEYAFLDMSKEEARELIWGAYVRAVRGGRGEYDLSPW